MAGAAAPAAAAGTAEAFGAFSSFRQVGDADWQTTFYNNVCFSGRRWDLLWQKGGTPLERGAFASTGFQRFPLRLLAVENVSEHIATQRHDACWADGVTYLADLRHAGGPTMGIAHFAKRLLRLYGLQRQAARYGLPEVDRIVLPATSARHLAHSWPRGLVSLVAPRAELVSADAMARAPCCYAHLIASARENTYFVRPEDASELRARAHMAAGARRACGGRWPVGCYFERSSGAARGHWEGGPRVVVNAAEVRAKLGAALERVGGELRIVTTNSSHTFAEQVRTFESCDLLVSVHGSHNANQMWMRPGAAFMEVNPYLFYYDSYEKLADVLGLYYLPSRRNEIGVSSASASRFVATYGRKFTDVTCQAHARCRTSARGFPTRVNMTDFDAQLSRGIAHLLANHSLRAPPHCGDEATPEVPATLQPPEAASEGAATGRSWRLLRAA